MILKRASNEAINFACKHYHYAKSVPVGVTGYSVFEEDQFCGVIIYARGANKNIGDAFGLRQGEVIELVRVALNGKQSSTSKGIAISLRLIKKDCPLAKLIVSYADEAQGHKGILYQATNWIFSGDSFAEKAIDPRDNKIKHTRTLHEIYGTIKGFQRVKDPPKHRYLYPLTEDLRIVCEKLRKPYPKSASVV